MIEVNTAVLHDFPQLVEVALQEGADHSFVELSAALDEQPSMLGHLHKMTLPTTVMVGAEDAPFVAPSREMAATLPHARLAVIPQAGHSPQYENADAWRAAVEAHLAWADQARLV